MGYHLIFDESFTQFVEEELFPMLGDLCETHSTLKDTDFSKFNENEIILTFLSDNQLKKIVDTVKEHQLVLAILPHTEAREASIGFGINLNLEKAIEYFRDEIEFINVDIIYSNGRPLFNSLVIGEAFQLTTSKFSKSFSKANQLKHFVKQFFNDYPQTSPKHTKCNLQKLLIIDQIFYHQSTSY